MAYTIWLVIALLAAVGVGLTGMVNGRQFTLLILLSIGVTVTFIALDVRRRWRAGERPARVTTWDRILSLSLLVVLQISLYAGIWMSRHGPYGAAAVGALMNLIWSWGLVKRLRQSAPRRPQIL